jgi:hypothetical protein
MDWRHAESKIWKGGGRSAPRHVLRVNELIMRCTESVYCTNDGSTAKEFMSKSFCQHSFGSEPSGPGRPGEDKHPIKADSEKSEVRDSDAGVNAGDAGRDKCALLRLPC